MSNLRQEGYWDEHYQLELKNYEDDGDEGEVWFGRGLSRRIASWLVDKLSPHIQDGNTQKIIDIGCGNAFMLVNLAGKLQQKLESTKIGDHLKLLGIDYSNNSINLSQKIVIDNNLSDSIELKQCNFLIHEEVVSASGGASYDAIIDKGTFDAICLLSSSSDNELETTKLLYLRSLYSLVRDGTIFVLASCNHTEEELISLFNSKKFKDYSVRLIDKLDTPKLQFGGKEGSQVTCLIIEFNKTDR